MVSSLKHKLIGNCMLFSFMIDFLKSLLQTAELKEFMQKTFATDPWTLRSLKLISLSVWPSLLIYPWMLRSLSSEKKERYSGQTSSSLSIKAINSPSANAMPLFRVALTPWFSWEINLMRGSFCANAWQISAERSVLPSSIRMTSIFR